MWTRLRNAVWLPLAAVVAFLTILTVTPVVVSRHIREMRDSLDVNEEARVVVNDLEEGLATQMLGAVNRSAGGSSEFMTRGGAHAQIDRDLRELDLLAARIGSDAVAHEGEVRTLVSLWQSRSTAGDVAATDGLFAALASARRLEDYLNERAALQRTRIDVTARTNVWTAILLAPLALASALVVFATGRRAVRFASEAEAGRAALARALESKATLMRGVTHDLKNPLGAALGYTELLQEGIAGDLTGPQREMVTRVRELVDVALDTVEDLLNLSRAEARDLDISRTEVDVAQLAGAVVGDHAAAAVTAGLTLSFVSPGESQLISTDASRVRHILGNLVSNAVKYTPRGGSIVVDLRRDTATTYVRVTDNGPGIPDAMRERIFDEFFRIPGAGADGIGIGLAISRRIARLLGGDVVVGERRDGGTGAVFELCLPLRLATGAGATVSRNEPPSARNA